MFLEIWKDGQMKAEEYLPDGTSSSKSTFMNFASPPSIFPVFVQCTEPRVVILSKEERVASSLDAIILEQCCSSLSKFLPSVS
jgi:hypothetical protein